MYPSAQAWLGTDFASFGGVVDPDLATAFATTLPTALGKTNGVLGSALCAQYCTPPQRAHLDKTGILWEYSTIAAALTPSSSSSSSLARGVVTN